MKARFRTNLDAPQRWVSDLNERGLDSRDFAMGDHVAFVNATGNREFCLRVVQRKVYALGNFTEIELHLPAHETRSIRDWEEWFKRHMGH